MSFSLDALRRTPNALARHYRHFRVDQRLLLTGHSHQAWPDVAWDGQLRAIDDAAEAADRKWSRAFDAATRVKQGYADWLDDPDGAYTLGASTHELLVRFLSAMPFAERPKLVTTRGEFHSVRRQLSRLAEEGVEVVWVPADAPHAIADRLIAEIDDRTAAVLVSNVLFRSSRIVPGLERVAATCERFGTELVVDTYHAVNVVPISIPSEGLDRAWVVGGGYKYCQLGEGNCFLRVPAHVDELDLRPVVTGWFAEFEALADPRDPDRVPYGRGAARFDGATYDPTSHYRARAVLDFFVEHGIDPALLRQVSQHQVGLLSSAFDALDLDPTAVRRDRAIPLEEKGGFLVLESPHAEALHQALFERGVLTDFRGANLRLGPAPYLSDRQLHDAVALLGESVRDVTESAP